MEARFEHNTFGKRLKSMLKVDFRRMFTMRLFYIIAGCCLVAPILILVMTTMFGGVDPETGEAVETEMFTNVWQIIGTISDTSGEISSPAAADNAAMSMDMTTMCNINMLYFGAAALVCLFISKDFKSGYSKNLFTVRAKNPTMLYLKRLWDLWEACVCCLRSLSAQCSAELSRGCRLIRELRVWAAL